MKRLYSASDIRGYARCPRQWWYEARGAELAALSAEEIERRLAALRRRHGARAEDLAAYQLLADLAARHEQLTRGREAHAAHARRALRPRIGCLPALLGLIALLWWPRLTGVRLRAMPPHGSWAARHIATSIAAVRTAQAAVPCPQGEVASQRIRSPAGKGRLR